MVRSQNSIPIPHVETGTDIDGQIYMRILFQVPTTEKPPVLLLLRVQLTSLMKNKKMSNYEYAGSQYHRHKVCFQPMFSNKCEMFSKFEEQKGHGGGEN